MIKRYYESLNSFHYSFGLMGASMLVFAMAFVYTNKHTMHSKILLGIAAAILAVIMFFYYRNKIRIAKALKKISHLPEYEDGGMVCHSYILADRMLVCYQFKIQEYKTTGITSIRYQEGKHGKALLVLNGAEGTIRLESDSRDQARHFAAFIEKQNPGVEMIDIKPLGEGTLKELGALE